MRTFSGCLDWVRSGVNQCKPSLNMHFARWVVLIELFFARYYGWGATSDYGFKIRDFAPTGAGWPKISDRRGRLPPTVFFQKTMLSFLSYGEKIWTYLSSVLSQSTRLTDGQTDRRTAFLSLDRDGIPCSAEKGELFTHQPWADNWSRLVCGWHSPNSITRLTGSFWSTSTRLWLVVHLSTCDQPSIARHCTENKTHKLTDLREGRSILSVSLLYVIIITTRCIFKTHCIYHLS